MLLQIIYINNYYNIYNIPKERNKNYPIKMYWEKLKKKY